MNNYSLILCLVVFIILFIVFTTFTVIVYNMTKRLINNGVEDENLIKEFSVKKVKKGSKVFKILDTIFLVILWIVLIGIFSVNILTAVKADNVIGEVPILKTVNSGSMSSKLESNKYLFENNLDNQIQTNDLVLLRKLPAEENIKLYDIILYEYNDILIFHRVVEIKEPTQDRDYRLFIFQGDAVKNHDREPVMYSQMKGIYQNEKIRYIGAFVRFMQTPPGYLCLALAFVICIGGPIYIDKLEKLRKNRYQFIINKKEKDNNLLKGLLDIWKVND